MDTPHSATHTGRPSFVLPPEGREESDFGDHSAERITLAQALRELGVTVPPGWLLDYLPETAQEGFEGVELPADDTQAAAELRPFVKVAAVAGYIEGARKFASENGPLWIAKPEALDSWIAETALDERPDARPPALLPPPETTEPIPTLSEGSDGILTVERGAFHQWWMQDTLV